MPPASRCMTLRPASIEELQEAVAQKAAVCQTIGTIDLRSLDRIRDHSPSDLTCTVECGAGLAALQHSLAAHGQWLPLDPPLPDRLTLRDVIDGNLTGPRRFGFGTVRDHLIGLEVLLADGSLIRSGGRVVKNVAGYDLHKLFIGSHGCLGIPVCVTFKLLPLPEATLALEASRPTPAAAAQLAATARRALPGLVALDVVRDRPDGEGCRVTVEFAGTTADVSAQADRASTIGFADRAAPGWDHFLWHDPESRPARALHLPSRLGPELEALGDRRFVARAGNGILHHEGSALRPVRRPSSILEQRLKQAMDPSRLLPALPA